MMAPGMMAGAPTRHIAAEQLPELRAVLGLTCHKAALLFHKELPWASATFTGTRHTIALEFRGVEAIGYAEDFISHFPVHEFSLPGKICADWAIVQVDRLCRREPVSSVAVPPEPVWTVTVDMLVLELHDGR